MNWWDDNALRTRPELAARTPFRDALVIAGAVAALLIAGIAVRAALCGSMVMP